jgi:glucuronoarabinoxylan endo-1,4-beta-xylanase
MKSMPRWVRAILGFILFSAPKYAAAQTATVNVSSQKQTIRGIGGMSHAAWAGDLTAAERELAFGNGDGQLGFTALRIPVTDGAPDSANVATAKAAIAAGAIVFATPWNSSGAMDSTQFASYATHLNNFVAYMKNQGVELYAIGTQNEPDYGAQGGWRTWTAAQCHDFALNYGATIATKLIACESYSYNKSFYDPILNDPAALANVAILGTHLYGTPLSSYPYPVADSKGGGRERWMTEHYTDSTTDANSWPNALGVATELHHAMVDGEFSLYTWWFIARSYGPIYTDGTVSKRGYCIAQFSKFIRPGFYRVDATASPSAGVWVSAYKSATDVVVVAVNTNSTTQPLTVSLNGSSIDSYDRFTTSATKSLTNDGTVSASNGSLSLSLDAASVTTLHGTGAVSVSDGGADGPDAGGSVDGGDSGSIKDASDFDSETSADGEPPPSDSGSISSGSSGSGDTDASGGTGTDSSAPGSSATTTAGASSPDGRGPGGCSCHQAGVPPSSAPAPFLGLLGVLSLGAIRRRSKADRAKPLPRC